MLEWIQSILFILVLLSFFASIYFSITYRRQKDPTLRGLFMARMNISMGLLLIFLSIIQLFLFTPSNTRVALGLIFFLVGLFNLFSGIRNHGIYSRH